MKNIQAIDGANNATFSVFQATDQEFALLFPDGTDVAFREDIEARLTEQQRFSTRSGRGRSTRKPCKASMAPILSISISARCSSRPARKPKSSTEDRKPPKLVDRCRA
jgi:hypothetical protein